MITPQQGRFRSGPARIGDELRPDYVVATNQIKKEVYKTLENIKPQKEKENGKMVRMPRRRGADLLPKGDARVINWKECEGCFGYCCIGSPGYSTTFLTLEDITKIARFLEMPESSFRREFVTRAGRNGVLTLKFGLNPCVFWRQGRCGIYPVRPWFCRQATPRMYSGTIPCKDWNRKRAGV